MILRPRIDIFPTRRWAGYAALVWVGSQVYCVFFGPSRNGVEDDAKQYVAGVAGRGVE